MVMLGRQLGQTPFVFPTRVSADGHPVYKPGGCTLLLSTLTAATGSTTTLPDGSTVLGSMQFMRYGQILTRITQGTVMTITNAGTGGTLALTIAGNKTAPIAFGASNAAVLAAVQALPNIGVGRVSVASTPNWVLTFADTLGAVPLATVDNTLLTGGVASIALTTPALSAGMYGPYDTAATDGRQVLTRGGAYILDEFYTPFPAGSFAPIGPGATTDLLAGVIEGGNIWKDRLLQCGAGTHSLAAGPTLAEFEAAFPLITYAQN